MGKKKIKKYLKKAMKSDSLPEISKLINESHKEVKKLIAMNERDDECFNHPWDDQRWAAPDDWRYNNDTIRNLKRRYPQPISDPNDMRFHFGDELPEEGIIKYLLNYAKNITIALRTVDNLGEKSTINIIAKSDGDITVQFPSAINHEDYEVKMAITAGGFISNIIAALKKQGIISHRTFGIYPIMPLETAVMWALTTTASIIKLLQSGDVQYTDIMHYDITWEDTDGKPLINMVSFKNTNRSTMYLGGCSHVIGIDVILSHDSHDEEYCECCDDEDDENDDDSLMMKIEEAFKEISGCIHNETSESDENPSADAITVENGTEAEGDDNDKESKE